MKVIVIFEDGKVESATLVDPGGEVCMDNLTNFVACPGEILKCIDNSIIEQCKMERIKKFIYLGENDEIKISD